MTVSSGKPDKKKKKQPASVILDIITRGTGRRVMCYTSTTVQEEEDVTSFHGEEHFQFYAIVVLGGSGGNSFLRHVQRGPTCENRLL